MQRYRIIVTTALVLCLAAFAAIAAVTAVRGGGEPNAAVMPTACENLVDATMLLAQHGSSSAVPVSGADPFGGDAEARSAETLQHLLDACDAELATMAR